MSNIFYMNFEDLRRWNAGLLDGIEEDLRKRCDTLVGLSDELLLSTAPNRWLGEAAAGAREKLLAIHDHIETIVAEAAAARRSIQHAADSVLDLGWLISEADGIAAAHQFEIQGQSVSDIKPADQKLSADAERDRATIAADLRDRVKEIHNKAKRTDLELLEILARIATGKINDGGVGGLTAASAAGEAQGISFIERYQVTSDPDGDVPGAGITAGEAKMLGNRVDRIPRVQQIKKFSEESAEANYSSSHKDAARHALASAMLAQEYGKDWANEFTTAHERQSDNNPTDMAMDLHNNEVGRRIAAEHPDATPQELERYVDDALRKGELVVTDSDNNLVRSDEVPIEAGPGRRHHLHPAG